MTHGDGLGNNAHEIYSNCIHKNVSDEYKPFSIFCVNKVLSTRGLLPLLDITFPDRLIPNRFVGMFTTDVSYLDIIDIISDRTIRSLTQEALRETKYSLRQERKRPWGIKTRRPFRGYIDKLQITFEQKIELAQKVVDELGSPIKQSNRGRPPVYDMKKIAVVLLTKGTLSFKDLATKIKEISYNMTVDGSKRYPCSSELHHVLEKIPVKWLEKALQKLDDISPETLSKFEEDMNIFVIDGSAITCETLSERIVAMKPLLMREFHKYLALIRITTNTIRSVKKSTNKIRGIINYLPEGSLVLADTEFDAENNYRIARESKIDLQVKQRKGGRTKAM